MALRNFIKRLIFGITIPQEYVCLPNDEIKDPFTVIATGKLDHYTIDVSSSHIFLGYKPVIIALCSEKNEDIVWIKDQRYVSLSFLYTPWSDRISNKTSRGQIVATLLLEKTSVDFLDQNSRCFLFRAVNGNHRFLRPVHDFANRVVNKLKRKAANNIDLAGNLEDQVRIAYSIPRSIALLTVWKGGLINIFPTDLHGRIDQHYYVSSLRIGGKANRQVEETKEVVLCHIDVNKFREVYALGKNHMQDYRPIDQFKFTQTYSSCFQIPVHQGCISYVELRQVESVDIGIHRIHLYKIISQFSIREASTLSHVHQYYIEWRKANNLPTKLFLR